MIFLQEEQTLLKHWYKEKRCLKECSHVPFHFKGNKVKFKIERPFVDTTSITVQEGEQAAHPKYIEGIKKQMNNILKYRYEQENK